jgi:hypothetical protein
VCPNWDESGTESQVFGLIDCGYTEAEFDLADFEQANTSQT